MKQPSVTVVMPAYNEADNIEVAMDDVCSTLSERGIVGEILVIDDGSSDTTAALVDKYAKTRPLVRLIQHAENKGFGAAFWTGAQNAKGDVVFCIPGDAENKCEEIIRYLPLFEHVDIVVPYIYNSHNRSFSRRLISKLYKSIINMTFGTLLNYMNGTVMYRRIVLQSVSLKSFGFFFQTELLIKSIWRGYLYAEVPCAIEQRLHGSSSALSFSSLWALSKDYFITIAAVYASRKKDMSSLAAQTASRQRFNLLQQSSQE